VREEKGEMEFGSEEHESAVVRYIWETRD